MLVSVAFGGSVVGLACVVIVFAMRSRYRVTQPMPIVRTQPDEICVKAVTYNLEPYEHHIAASTSRAVFAVCGNDANADRYEARNDALRSIMRSRSQTKEDAAALMAYLASTNDAMRVERVAALKNDVMNLLRNQEPPVEGLADALIAMFDGGAHPPAVLDYCIQHLGAMQGGLNDTARRRVLAVLAMAAARKGQSYAGTALYSLAADRRATSAQRSELRRLALALCAADANTAARIAAIQLAGERGYAEALPVLRKALSSPRRDAVIDIVAIGLIGDSSDISRLSHFIKHDSRRALAAEAALRRINERSGAK